MKQLPFVLALVLCAAPLCADDQTLDPKTFVAKDGVAVKVHNNDVDFIGTKKGILACTLGPTCRVMHMPLLRQADPNLDADVKDMGGSGCYLTSMATVILTALANRDPGRTPAGRTKTFMNIPAGNAAKVIEQLSQEYRWAKEDHQDKIVDGKPGQVFHLPEVAADFGNIVEDCDPFVFANCSSASNASAHAFRTFVKNDDVTNAFVRGLMERNYVVLIAYARYKPVDLGGGKIGFELQNRHKVVFSGFRPGRYPLSINNVGNGTRVRGRLSTDLTQRKYSMNARPAASSFVYPASLKTKTYLEYDGAGLDTDELVFFIEHIDALKIVTSDDLTATKLAAPALVAKGCRNFLGRVGDYLCTSDSGFAACEKARKDGKAMVCRRAGQATAANPQ